MNKPKIYVMVGLSGSGKSTIAKELSKKENCVIVSSDGIRKEICGRVEDQSKNNEVFKIFHKRIKENLLNGNNVIADATNITMKARRSLLSNISKVFCEKIAYVVPKKMDQLFIDNKSRPNPVPDEVLIKQQFSFQIPFIEEGFDEIVIHKFENEYVNDVFVLDCYEKMRGFDQKNPHHTMDLDEHCKFTHDKFKMMEGYVWTEYPFATRLHDIGKLFTQKFDEDGVAHYYRHENVGCYYLLSNLESIKKHREYSDEELLNILFLVNYHMMPMNWESDKVKRKYLGYFGEKKFNILMAFNECDKAR